MSLTYAFIPLHKLEPISPARKLVDAECRARGRGSKDPASRGDGDAESDNTLGAFEYTAEHPLECDAVLVDEASMLDLPLAAALLAALPPHRRPQLVLVGVHAAPVLEHIMLQRLQENQKLHTAQESKLMLGLAVQADVLCITSCLL